MIDLFVTVGGSLLLLVILGIIVIALWGAIEDLFNI